MKDWAVLQDAVDRDSSQDQDLGYLGPFEVALSPLRFTLPLCLVGAFAG